MPPHPNSAASCLSARTTGALAPPGRTLEEEENELLGLLLQQGAAKAAAAASARAGAARSERTRASGASEASDGSSNHSDDDLEDDDGAYPLAVVRCYDTKARVAKEHIKLGSNVFSKFADHVRFVSPNHTRGYESGDVCATVTGDVTVHTSD